MISKFSFFPMMYPGESLYSVIARYHKNAIGNSYKDTIEEIFGTRTISVSYEFPTHLEYLSESLNIPGLTKEKLLYNHTLYPFYEPFLFAHEQKDIKDKMFRNGGGGIKSEIGFLAGSILKKENFFFCPECIREDIEIYGESYFRVIWQAQGYLVCHKHNCYLEPYNTNIRNLSRVSYISLEAENVCDIKSRRNENVKLYQIVCMINGVLIGTLSLFNAEKLKSLYLKKLDDLDYLTINGDVSYRRILPNFIVFHGEILRLMDSEINPAFEFCWFRKIIRLKMVKVHPIRHLLYISFLFDNYNGLIEFSNKRRVRQKYLCLNKVCPKYKRRVINDVIISADYMTRDPVGTFKCPVCGYIYSRKLRDSNQYKKGRVKDFGPLFIDELRNIMNRDDMSLRQKARYLGCDPKTVKKYQSKYI